MATRKKVKHTSKQKRQASHIEESEKAQGRTSKKAAQIAWAAVNKKVHATHSARGH